MSRKRLWEVFGGEALVELRKLPGESVDCVVTSPPYWRMRDYGHEDQLGLEPTVDGTTGVTALRHGRAFIGIEIVPSTADIARKLIRSDSPLFNRGPT